jgi:hypothetical protein
VVTQAITTIQSNSTGSLVVYVANLHVSRHDRYYDLANWTNSAGLGLEPLTAAEVRFKSLESHHKENDRMGKTFSKLATPCLPKNRPLQGDETEDNNAAYIAIPDEQDAVPPGDAKKAVIAGKGSASNKKPKSGVPALNTPPETKTTASSSSEPKDKKEIAASPTSESKTVPLTPQPDQPQLETSDNKHSKDPKTTLTTITKDEQKTEVISAASKTSPTSSQLRLKVSAQEYLAEAKLKPAPGLLFKSVVPFRPLSSQALMDEETNDIQALARRLLNLRRTVQHDFHCLEATDSLTNTLVRDSKTVARRPSLPDAKAGGIGKTWASFEASEKAILAGPLDRLRHDDRLMVLDILAEVENELASYVALRTRAHNGWLQLKTAVRLGGLGKKAKAVTETARVNEVTVSRLPSSTVLDAKATAPAGGMLDMQHCYQEALLAYDRRSGWAKLEGAKKPVESQPKEQKEEQKSISSSALSTADPSTKIPLPPHILQLRQDLGVWLGSDARKVPLTKVQARLAAIQDYCRLSNRISECWVHLEHETQLARQVLAQFKGDAFKDEPALVQAVCQLAAAQDPELIRTLLGTLIDSIKSASLLEVHVLEGLATVLHYADAEQVSLGDLKIILTLLIDRSSGMGSDLSESDTVRLLQAIGAVLSAMALVSQQRQVALTAWLQDSREAKAAEAKEAKQAKPAAGKTTESFLLRMKRAFDAKKEAVMNVIDGPADQSGLAILAMTDYEDLCLKLNSTLLGSLESRFDCSDLNVKNPELFFAASVVRQALMRIAHKEQPRAQRPMWIWVWPFHLRPLQLWLLTVVADCPWLCVKPLLKKKCRGQMLR